MPVIGRRALRRATVGAALLVSLAVAGAVALPSLAAARAAGAASASSTASAPRLMVSDDGRLWQARLDSGLFADGLPLVPGGSTSGTFWVKNTTSEPAMLGARIVGITSSTTEFARDVSVTAWASGLDDGDALGGQTFGGEAEPDGVALDGSPSVLPLVEEAPVADAAPVAQAVPLVTLDSPSCSVVMPSTLLPAGEEAPITVALRLAADASEASAAQSVGVTVLVTLTGQGGETLDPCVSTGGSETGSGAGPAGDRADDQEARSAATGGSTSAGSASSGSVTSAARPATGAVSIEAASGGEGVDGGATADDGSDALAGAIPFVSVPLPGEWLPIAVGVLALLGGGYVALGRRRRDRGDADDAGDRADSGEHLVEAPSLLVGGPRMTDRRRL
ncbi:hypothetical protein [Frigoribacterium sp. CFBP9030]|uniref:hypothetical protein n=1 Tax=Frigoribacterium sp. CFBP9030 TaxID=3096537 RepID=UPI002A6B726D|nr:hypothetical protein [Frigoribacterium sp. CFBP9030]MDY0891375.1 hypothetical protein [Frigoribacterium sp. CFBP9030]